MTTYDLGQLRTAFAARASDWSDLGVVCGEPSAPTQTAKPASHVTFESPTHIGDLVVWVSGEADGGVVRLADGRRMEKVYALRSREDLDAAVDELITFMRSGLVPDGGFLWDR